MATALDVAFARRYYRWFWQGSIGGIAFTDQRKRVRLRSPAIRARYRATMRGFYGRVDLSGAQWDNDPAKTVCEVCLHFNVPTLLVTTKGKGPISLDMPGDLVCAKCHPEAATRILMAQVNKLVAAE